SHKNFHSGHLEAGTIALTGTLEGPAGGLAPNFGSILARQRGARSLPPFLSLGRGSPRDVVGVMKGYGGGNWGKIYDPFLVQCAEDGQVDIPSLKLLENLTPEHLNDRRLLLQEIDHFRRTVDSALFQKWDSTLQRAYALLTAPEAR